MIDKLMKILVQEIPAELSVCVFHCRKPECRFCDYRECNHYHRIVQGGCDDGRENGFAVQTELTT